jgi:hypothetical protein
MHSPGPMTDYLINGMAAMIGKRDRRKPVAAYSGPIELDQRLGRHRSGRIVEALDRYLDEARERVEVVATL